MRNTTVAWARPLRTHQWLPYTTVFVAGLAWTTSLWLRSPGTPYHDEIGHLLICRNAWNYPSLALHVWGRVGHTLLYMVPSLFGLNGARLASVFMACAIVLLATGVARALGVRHLFLVPLFLWFQPWYGGLMYTAITQVPFTLLMILAVQQCLSGRSSTASMAFGLLPLVRHEGIALLALWSMYLVARREWRPLLMGAAPTVLYNAAYLVLLAPPLRELPVCIYFQPTSSYDYGTGSWSYYASPTLWGVGKVVVVWAALGLLPAWRLRHQMAYLFCYPVYFVVHTVLYHFGLYGSGGYELIFMSPTAPAFALLAALGADDPLNRAEALVRRLPRVWIRSVVIAGVAGVLLVAPVLYKALQVKPRLLNPEEVAVSQAAQWLRTQPIRPSDVVATHVWFYYLYQLPWTPEHFWYTPPPVPSMPRGTVAVWDEHYSDLFGMARDSFRPDQGWRQLTQFGPGQVVVFQRQ